MKYKKEIVIVSGKTAYLIACSLEELKLLFGVVDTAYYHFPRNLELSQNRGRLLNIKKELKKVYNKKSSENKL